MTVPLIPRRTFFGNPDHMRVRISPDGSRLAWLAPHDGVLNIWLSPADNPAAARPVTRDRNRGVHFYHWAGTGKHILYLQDKQGDEDWHIHVVDLDDLSDRDVTPFPKTQARICHISDARPEEVAVGLNNRNPQWHDLYRLNIITGALTLTLEHNRFNDVVVDNDLRLREATAVRPDGGVDVFYPDGKGGYEKRDEIPESDNLTTGRFGFSRDGRTLYMEDSRGRDTAALVAVDHQTRSFTVLAEDARCDLTDVIVNPVDLRVAAAAFTYERKRWQAIDPAVKEDLDYLCTVADGEIEVTGSSDDFATWIVAYIMDTGPCRYYRYERKTRTAQFLFTSDKRLESQPLVPMHSVQVTSRDGLNLVCYYSLPAGSDREGTGVPDRPLPLVLIPHGGPWGRDFWGYSALHQWLANRGYVVLDVNFRSSTGFGKSFTNAGDREWGGKIIEDQVDAVRWAIDKGIADPAKIAVMGASFGGFSTLAQLTLHPDLFACGVDIVGPSNLITLLESVPEYWKPELDQMTRRVGDHRTEEGRVLLKKHSPLTYANHIIRPLLIGQGANDPRVKRSEADQIVKALRDNNIPVTYVLYPDEGHGFARPENRLSFFAIAEAFLAKNLGGSCQPVGEDFTGSTHQIVVDSGEIEGIR